MLQHLLSICVFPLLRTPHHGPTPIHFLGHRGRRIWILLRSGDVAVSDSDYGPLEEDILSLDRSWRSVADSFVETTFYFDLQMADQ